MKNIAFLALLFCMAACSKDEFKPTELIAFTRQIGNDYVSTKIHVMHPDGSNVRILGDGGGVGGNDMAWSADGRMIAYSNGDGIYTMNMDGFKVTEVLPNTFNPAHPTWSPDGSYLAFTYYNFWSCASSICSNITRIFVASLNGPGITPTNVAIDTLKEWQAYDLDPAWSPDGEKIVFCSNRATIWDNPESNEGSVDIYIMNPDGTEVTRLTESFVSEGTPVWSPDGKKIAFEGRGNGNSSSSIYVMNADGSDLLQVTHNLTDYGHYPTWSPDGTRLAFASDHDGNSEIYIINIDGTGLKRLTNDSREDKFPVWSPGKIEVR